MSKGVSGKNIKRFGNLFSQANVPFGPSSPGTLTTVVAPLYDGMDSGREEERTTMEKDKEFTVARLILRMANQIVKNRNLHVKALGLTTEQADSLLVFSLP